MQHGDLFLYGRENQRRTSVLMMGQKYAGWKGGMWGEEGNGRVLCGVEEVLDMW